MPRRVLIRSALVLGALLRAPTLQAQAEQRCPDTLTVEACLRQLLGESPEGGVAERTTKATTGANLVSGSATSAIRDFLPRVAGALLTPGLEEDRSELALRFNQRIGFATAQVGVELAKPELYKPIVDALPESIRDASQRRLESTLEDQDDVRGTLALNFENQWLGRAFQPHADSLSALVSRIVDAAGDDDERALGRLTDSLDFDGKVDPARRGDPACQNANSAQVPLGCYVTAFADSVRYFLAEEAEALLARRGSRRAALTKAGIDAISMLLNNQPQLNVTAAFRYRDELVGPDELTASLRYEQGVRNLNWLRSRCSQLTATCFTSLVNSAATREAIGRAARLWVEGDLTYRREYDLSLPGDTVLVAEERTSELKLSAGYGQYFGRLAGGTRRPRIDLDASYHHQLQGEMRTSRLVAKAAYTQPVTDALAGVFGVVWANKPEFLGDVQRNLSARLGLTYKLVQQE